MDAHFIYKLKRVNVNVNIQTHDDERVATENYKLCMKWIVGEING